MEPFVEFAVQSPTELEPKEQTNQPRNPLKTLLILAVLFCIAVLVGENWNKVLGTTNTIEIESLIEKIEHGYILSEEELTRLRHEPGIERKLSPRGLFNLTSRSKPSPVNCDRQGDLDQDAQFFGQMNAYMREGKPFPCAPDYMWGKWKFVYLKSGKVFFGVDGSQYMIPILGMGAHSDITDAMRPLFSDIAGGGYIEVLKSGTIVAGGYSGSFGRVPETQQQEVLKILQKFFPGSKVEWEFFQEDQWGNTSRANE